jgi:hypothetical protein
MEPLKYEYVAGNCGNRAFPEMTRHFRKCLEFLQLPRQFREYFFSLIPILGKCITGGNNRIKLSLLSQVGLKRNSCNSLGISVNA